ncbi:MAG TPA: DMT family transporter [Propionibacteriaceae bacterium]|nr:DMT family transporter [Propionibacteriaceae bacterium]
MIDAWRNPGVRSALASAVLFGLSAPLAKLLLGDVSPWLLAGLLYCGSGAGLWLYRLVTRARFVPLQRGDIVPLAGAVLAGGVVAPVLLLLGLSAMPASGASLLLNAEGVFTSVLAWVVFREHLGRRIVLGMAAIVVGAGVLSVPYGVQFGTPLPALAILAACACWGLDNNLTRKVALNDATLLAAVKGAVAGPVNLVLALVLGSGFPGVVAVGGALLVGFLSYGLSLVLFIRALAAVGTARAGAYFAVAPFVGALVAVAMGEAVTWSLVLAGLLMAVGLWLHLTERHRHEHTHAAVTHTHAHTHDTHHEHEHDVPVPDGTWHTHEHTHLAVTHSHEHYPDAHHRHRH